MIDIIDIKILIIGDSGTGKSLFLRSFDCDYQDSEVHNPQPTIGIDFITKELVIENQKLKIRIWDTGKFFYLFIILMF